MELLSPTHPPGRFPGFSPPESFRQGFTRASRTATFQVPEIVEESGSGSGGGVVHVAVGKSVGKAVSLLNWTLGRFGGWEICLLHVHQPSPLIPTLCNSPLSLSPKFSMQPLFKKLKRLSHIWGGV